MTQNFPRSSTMFLVNVIVHSPQAGSTCSYLSLICLTVFPETRLRVPEKNIP